MDLLHGLLDPALKRLYKFILKRVVGPYLEEELNLDQLDVAVRRGRVELRDVALSAPALNAHLPDGSTLCVYSGRVGRAHAVLTVHPSADEPCTVELTDVEIVLAPMAFAPQYVDDAEPPAAASSDDPVRMAGVAELADALDRGEDDEIVEDDDEEETPPDDDASREGLECVAEWIEQITDTIKLTVRGLTVRVLDPATGLHADATVDWLEASDESTPEAASSTKAVHYRGLAVSVMQADGCSVRVAEGDAQRTGRVRVHVDAFADVDCFAHSLRVVLDPGTIATLSALLGALTAEPPAAAAEALSASRDQLLGRSVLDGDDSWLRPEEPDGAVLTPDSFRHIEALLREAARRKAEGLTGAWAAHAFSVAPAAADGPEFFDAQTAAAGQPDQAGTQAGPSVRLRLHLRALDVVLCAEDRVSGHVGGRFLPTTAGREHLLLASTDAVLRVDLLPQATSLTLELAEAQLDEHAFPFGTRDPTRFEVRRVFGIGQGPSHAVRARVETRAGADTLVDVDVGAAAEVQWEMSILRRWHRFIGGGTESPQEQEPEPEQEHCTCAGDCLSFACPCFDRDGACGPGCGCSGCGNTGRSPRRAQAAAAARAANAVCFHPMARALRAAAPCQCAPGDCGSGLCKCAVADRACSAQCGCSDSDCHNARTTTRLALRLRPGSAVVVRFPNGPALAPDSLRATALRLALPDGCEVRAEGVSAWARWVVEFASAAAVLGTAEDPFLEVSGGSVTVDLREPATGDGTQKLKALLDEAAAAERRTAGGDEALSRAGWATSAAAHADQMLLDTARMSVACRFQRHSMAMASSELAHLLALFGTMSGGDDGGGGGDEAPEPTPGACYMAVDVFSRAGTIALNEQFTLATEGFRVLHVSQIDGLAASRVALSARGATLFEAGCAEPVLSRPPWWAGDADALALVVETDDTAGAVRNVTVTLALSRLVLRYDVQSAWVFDFVDAVIPDAFEDPEEPFPVDPALAARPSFTKLFVSVSDAAVDYSPPELPRYRAVLTLGVFRLTSNLVSNAARQGYTLSLWDAALHLAQDGPRAADFAGGLEANAFVRVATLGVMDAFLRRQLVPFPDAPDTPETDLELSVRDLSFFTCADSLFALIDVAQAWYAEYMGPPDVHRAEYVGAPAADDDDQGPPEGGLLSAVRAGVFAAETPEASAALASSLDEEEPPPRAAHLSQSGINIDDDYYTLANSPTAQPGVDRALAASFAAIESASDTASDGSGEQDTTHLEAAAMLESIMSAAEPSADSQDDEATALAATAAATATALLDRVEANTGDDELTDGEEDEEDEELAPLPPTLQTGGSLAASWLFRREDPEHELSAMHLPVVDMDEEGGAEAEDELFMSALPADDGSIMLTDDVQVRLDDGEALREQLSQMLTREDALAADGAGEEEEDEEEVEEAVEEVVEDEEAPDEPQEQEDDPDREAYERAWNEPLAANQECAARWFGAVDAQGRTRVRIMRSYVPIPSEAGATLSPDTDALRTGRNCVVPRAVQLRVHLKDMNLSWRLFGGADWDAEAAAAAQRAPPAGTTATPKAEPEPAKGLFDDLDQGAAAAAQPTSLLAMLVEDYDPAARQQGAEPEPAAAEPAAALGKLGKLGRRIASQMVEVRLSRTQAVIRRFGAPAADEVAARQQQAVRTHVVVGLQDVEVLDCIRDSYMRSLLCYWRSERHVRHADAFMLRVSLTTVMPDLGNPMLNDEYRLRLRALPLRLNVDQAAVDFFAGFAAAKAERDRPGAAEIVEAPDALPDVLAGYFFQSVDVRGFTIKLDYQPQRVDTGALREGHVGELINLFPLEGMELSLRSVRLVGVDGLEAAAAGVASSWASDIARKQLHKCLASVSMPPIRAVANVSAGAADLVLLPMEQYAKHGRLTKGLKDGAYSFLRAVTLEALSSASKLAAGTQTILEHADDIVGTGGGSAAGEQTGGRLADVGGAGAGAGAGAGGGDQLERARNKMAQQPGDVTEGLSQAYTSLARGFQTARNTIVAVPMVEYRRSRRGSKSYVKSVIRAVPVAVLGPMIGATEAVNKAILGVRNTLDPEAKHDNDVKYKRR